MSVPGSTKRFKALLKIMRFVCQQNLRIGAGEFDFNHETYYQVNLKIDSI